MLHVMLYFIISYSLVALLLIALRKRLMRCRTRVARLGGAISVVGLLAGPLVPYGIVEAQTIVYWQALAPAVRSALTQVGEPGDIVSMKVLRIRPGQATVYVVTQSYRLGHAELSYAESDIPKFGYTADVMTFARLGNTWKFQEDSWSCVWSDFGSADGNVFPPYPSKGDYD